jgi:hypothetical protein
MGQIHGDFLHPKVAGDVITGQGVRFLTGILAGGAALESHGFQLDLKGGQVFETFPGLEDRQDGENNKNPETAGKIEGKINNKNNTVDVFFLKHLGMVELVSYLYLAPRVKFECGEHNHEPSTRSCNKMGA